MLVLHARASKARNENQFDQQNGDDHVIAEGEVINN